MVVLRVRKSMRRVITLTDILMTPKSTLLIELGFRKTITVRPDKKTTESGSDKTFSNLLTEQEGFMYCTLVHNAQSKVYGYVEC